MEQTLAAEFMAYVLWACLFLLVFHQRVYYLAVCLLVAVVVGGRGLEFVPALWVPVELVLGLYAFFVRVRKFSLSRGAK